ncbi:hypothetical protein GH714_035705 [Hevea brasiliensis]|uniref:Uncharacterized protein n=1 Tax=Hevea brasiliensis TaxID=3981 RepID=A0A6A6ND93_HEVBR|nr:hypothetical protein GH714_035705 [Hevea brasiliensis]
MDISPRGLQVGHYMLFQQYRDDFEAVIQEAYLSTTSLNLTGEGALQFHSVQRVGSGSRSSSLAVSEALRGSAVSWV